jgi:hypothetical protein
MLNKLQEIEFVLERASEHLDWLRKRVRHPDPDLIPDDDRRILEESFDHYAGDIRIRIGECAGSLRNALNYLIWADAFDQGQRSHTCSRFCRDLIHSFRLVMVKRDGQKPFVKQKP